MHGPKEVKFTCELFAAVEKEFAPTQTELDAALAAEVRAERDNLLVAVDVVVSNPLRWADLSSDKQTEWTVYRQALLDVPQQSGFPSKVVWPPVVT